MACKRQVTCCTGFLPVSLEYSLLIGPSWPSRKAFFSSAVFSPLNGAVHWMIFIWASSWSKQRYATRSQYSLLWHVACNAFFFASYLPNTCIFIIKSSSPSPSCPGPCAGLAGTCGMCSPRPSPTQTRGPSSCSRWRRTSCWAGHSFARSSW